MRKQSIEVTAPGYSTGVAKFTRDQTWGSCIDYFLCVRSSLRTVAITLEYFIRVYAYEYAVQMYCTVLYMSTSTVLNSHWELNNSFVCAVFTHGIDAPVNYCLRKLSNASRVFIVGTVLKFRMFLHALTQPRPRVAMQLSIEIPYVSACTHSAAAASRHATQY